MVVRIQPEITTAVIGGIEARVRALLLGGVPRGAVVIIAGPEGLDDMTAVDTMNSLAQHGYESVLAELPDVTTSDDLAYQVVEHLVGRMTDRGWTHEQIGVIGYGMGARAALVAGSVSAFGAAISIPHDPRQLTAPHRITDLRTPWLGVVGLGPSRELAGDVAAYREEVRIASSEHTSLVGYPGVQHCLRDSTDGLEHQAVFDTWQRTAEWLNAHVVPRPTPLAEAWRDRQQSVQTTSSL